MAQTASLLTRLLREQLLDDMALTDPAAAAVIRRGITTPIAELKESYVAGRIEIEEFEAEVWRYLTIRENSA